MMETNKLAGEGVFVESSGIDMNITTIRGVQYIVFSFFDGEKTVDRHLESLIRSSFDSSTVEEITSESLVDSGIAIQEP